MFDHIHFFQSNISYDLEKIKNEPTYRKFESENRENAVQDQSYHIDGTSRYILSHPMTEERKKELIYIQSFSYMNSGPEYYTRRENYRSYLFSYTYSGEGILLYDGNEYILKKGCGFLIDCRKLHYYKTDQTEWTHGDLHIYGGNTEAIYKGLFEEQPPVFRVNNFIDLQELLENILRLHTGGNSGRDYEVSAGINQLLMIAYHGLHFNTVPQLPKNIFLLQRYIEQHFTEELNTEQLSAFACISKYHLIRQFKQYTGFTPHAYIVHLRVLQAADLLLTTDLPSYQIGQLLGFTTEANYIRQFKLEYGCTPGQYRSEIQHSSL